MQNNSGLSKYFLVPRGQVLALYMGVMLGGLIFGACVPKQPIGTPSVAGTPSVIVINTPILIDAPTRTPAEPVDTPIDITRMRPYTENSTWNTPIGPSPQYDPHSAEMVATIGLDAGGQITSNPNAYNRTIYYVDESTPRWDIPCTRYACTVVTLDKTSKTEMLTGVPIPFDARPASGTDASMIIIDKTNYTEYNLWGVERNGTGWTARNGSVYNILWDAMPADYGSGGAGIPYYAGLIRPWEIIQGHIDHAIAFAYPYPAQDRCVFPASKTDGNSSLPYAIPEGARLQLDPSLTEADLDRMGLDRTGKIIAWALQQYGMILINYGGRTKINVENLADNPYATIQWSDPDLNLTPETVANIPYTDFRVIALPEAYWNPTPDSPTHGKCYAYP